MAHATRLQRLGASIVIVAAAMTASAASAQVNPPNREQQLETQGQSPPSSPSENLSERLDRSQGVITPPPSGDRDIHITPPNPDSKMPVIPPPGSRDGDTTVQPK